MKKTKFEIEPEDYSQSANTLFNFMMELQYLQDILKRKAVVPRYCTENIAYLDINSEGTAYPEILVLQKCFCDIPLHKITQSFRLEGCGEQFDKLTEVEKKKATENNTHPDLYGRYAIGFTKSWGVRNNLQPITYTSTGSNYAYMISTWINKILGADDIDDVYVYEVLNRLAYLKPLRGVMKRKFQKDGTLHNQVDIEVNKNFYDEQEWRYVPPFDKLKECELDSVIANPVTIKMKAALNRNMQDDNYASLWLRYNYDEIRYIIVPDINARNEIIKTIMEISDTMFSQETDIEMQRYTLISKILVLDEIKKDW